MEYICVYTPESGVQLLPEKEGNDLIRNSKWLRSDYDNFFVNIEAPVVGAKAVVVQLDEKWSEFPEIDVTEATVVNVVRMSECRSVDDLYDARVDEMLCGGCDVTAEFITDDDLCYQ